MTEQERIQKQKLFENLLEMLNIKEKNDHYLIKGAPERVEQLMTAYEENPSEVEYAEKIKHVSEVVTDMYVWRAVRLKEYRKLKEEIETESSIRESATQYIQRKLTEYQAYIEELKREEQRIQDEIEKHYKKERAIDPVEQYEAEEQLKRLQQQSDHNGKKKIVYEDWLKTLDKVELINTEDE